MYFTQYSNNAGARSVGWAPYNKRTAMLRKGAEARIGTGRGMGRGYCLLGFLQMCGTFRRGDVGISCKVGSACTFTKSMLSYTYNCVEVYDQTYTARIYFGTNGCFYLACEAERTVPS
jgi:hypothetical protein